MSHRDASLDEPYTEHRFANAITTAPRLTIAVPTYRDDARPLIARLAAQPDAANCALLLFDDGSGRRDLIDAHTKALAAFPGPAAMISANLNRGRSTARNRLVSLSETDWILFLDADMLPDDDRFLQHYLDELAAQSSPALIAGGFTVKQIKPNSDQRLHYVQADRYDCVDAAARAREPGRFVYSSNILAHRCVLESVRFDEAFSGWGWEDVDWGLRVAAQFEIRHIDNSATHLGLETDSVLVEKFGTSGENFARLVQKHPEAARSMPLFRAARTIKPFAFAAPIAKSAALQKAFPDYVRVTALKLFRAMMYSKYL